MTMGAAHGVAVLHGFTSTPSSVEPVAEALREAGFAVEVPLLPGHGTCWRDLEITSAESILRQAHAAADRLAARCRTVSAVGLSMGGTLAVHLAARRGLAGAVTVNPGLRLAHGTGSAARLLHRVKRTVPGVAGDIAMPGRTEEAYPRTPVRAVVQLDRIFAQVRGELPELRRRGTPVLLLSSARDNVLPPGSADPLRRALPASQLTEELLPHSLHVATLDHDAGTVRRRTVEFLVGAAERAPR